MAGWNWNCWASSPPLEFPAASIAERTDAAARALLIQTRLPAFASGAPLVPLPVPRHVRRFGGPRRQFALCRLNSTTRLSYSSAAPALLVRPRTRSTIPRALSRISTLSSTTQLSPKRSTQVFRTFVNSLSLAHRLYLSPNTHVFTSRILWSCERSFTVFFNSLSKSIERNPVKNLTLPPTTAAALIMSESSE